VAAKKLAADYIVLDTNSGNDQRWLWFRRIPIGLVTLVSGVGGAGKTKAMANIISTVFHQDEFPDGIHPGVERGHVVVLTTENDKYMLGKDFYAQGCDEIEDGPFLHIASFVTEEGSDEQYVFDFDRDLPLLEDLLKEWRPICLIIDPLREFHSRKDNDALQIRALMMKLNQLAKKYDLALLGVIHWNKDEKQGKQNRMAGSHQYRDAVRSVIIIEQDSKDKKLRHFIQDKMNIEQEPDDLEFTIESPHGVVVWAPVEGIEVPTQVSECQEWLVALLSEGPKPIRAIIDESKFNERTVFRARKALGNVIYKSSKFLEYKYVEFWELAGPENGWGLGPLSIDPPGTVHPK